MSLEDKLLNKYDAKIMDWFYKTVEQYGLCVVQDSTDLRVILKQAIKEAKEEGRKEGKQEADHPVGGIDMKQAEKVFLNGLK